MTTHVDHLALIAQTINTQYDLARIELFRPLEIYDRWNGIKASDIGAAGGWGCACKPQYRSLHLDRLDEYLLARLQPFGELVRDGAAMAGGILAIGLYDNIATCSCSDRKPISKLSVRVSITWNGRTLTREYALPEVGK